MSLAPAALPAPPQSTLMRKRYVPLYLEYLKARAANTATSKLLSPVPAPELGDMDRALPEHTILMFRRLAHAELQREKRREARAAKAAGGSGAAAASRSWVGWLVGAGPPVEGAHAAGEGKPGEEEHPALSSQEYSRLLELVNEQEEGLRLGTETPFTLLTKIRWALLGRCQSCCCPPACLARLLPLLTFALC